MALTTTIGVTVDGIYTKTADLSTAADNLSKRYGAYLATGTGAGKADLRFADTRTLAASATEDIDLAGSLVDIYGATLTFAKVKAIVIAAAAGNTNNVVIGAGTNPWITALNSTGTITLRPGAFIMLGAGAADATTYAVTAGTGDILKITNSAGSTSVSYDIVIIGSSA
ncbi:hypothetical protein J7F03_20770 [Streptomyces sp. ISL-43]|uniref:hypothetical protein n=1 Tax=Streptomyces sp. ISL-43 TaxID=2819183 RepID=UPI001BEA60AF|nr:hypothetical protein [Streptomyces sp. ISL-43]MBT2449477.1 hypothetical protein [Streptomyces sp. ISL-43]